MVAKKVGWLGQQKVVMKVAKWEVTKAETTVERRAARSVPRKVVMTVGQLEHLSAVQSEYRKVVKWDVTRAELKAGKRAEKKAGLRAGEWAVQMVVLLVLRRAVNWAGKLGSLTAASLAGLTVFPKAGQ